MVRDLKIQDGKISLTLALTIPEYQMRDQIAQDTRLTVNSQELRASEKAGRTARAVRQMGHGDEYGHQWPYAARRTGY